MWVSSDLKSHSSCYYVSFLHNRVQRVFLHTTLVTSEYHWLFYQCGWRLSVGAIRDYKENGVLGITVESQWRSQMVVARHEPHGCQTVPRGSLIQEYMQECLHDHFFLFYWTEVRLICDFLIFINFTMSVHCCRTSWFSILYARESFLVYI